MNATDEYLENAAKAVPYVMVARNKNGAILGFIDATRMTLWNPLNDDGDAFRLATALEIIAYYSDGKALAEYYLRPRGTEMSREVVTMSVDRFYAMRFAITCAAAEIGKTLQNSAKRQN